MDVGYIGGVTALIEWGSKGKKRKCVSNAAKMPVACTNVGVGREISIPPQRAISIRECDGGTIVLPRILAINAAMIKQCPTP
jgi:hypothetical protein